MPDFRLADGALTLDGDPLFESISPDVTALADPADPLERGIFLGLVAAADAPRHEVDLGTPTDVDAFVGGYRDCPWWMKPTVGTALAGLPAETQFLVVRRGDGRFLVVLPILDGPFRTALAGAAGDHVQAVAESGDPAVTAHEITLAFVAVGSDPYTLMAQAAESAIARMGTGRLRRDKPVPALIDAFGWCTWDAFYQEVSHEKVREGLESFRAAGVPPRWMILDDGWQSVASVTGDGVERRLTGFEANEKFPGDLAPTVQMAKEDFGVEELLVWHAMQGYWAGVDEEFAPYGARSTAKAWSPEIIALDPEKLAEDRPAGLVPPAQIDRFFHDYHRHLAAQGVDGVKVDSQAVLEAMGTGHGGRVALMRRYHEALEGSVHVHFTGNLVNCMSASTDMLYQAPASSLTRSSDDFYPSKPESHGRHVWANAVSSLFMGELVHPDWDMFQSGHEAGAFHAMARAISGGPVYVSDKPGAHDAGVLGRLVHADGTIPRCEGIGRPTADCLFTDFAAEARLLKIFNHNPLGGVVGLFNVRAGGGDDATITGALRPADVDGLAGERFAVWLHHARALHLLGHDEAIELTLGPLSAEIATVAPVEDGLAIVGLTDKYNSGATAEPVPAGRPGMHTIEVRDGGPLVAWADREPATIYMDAEVADEVNDETGADVAEAPDEASADYEYDEATARLTIHLPPGGRWLVTIEGG